MAALYCFYGGANMASRCLRDALVAAALGARMTYPRKGDIGTKQRTGLGTETPNRVVQFQRPRLGYLTCNVPMNALHRPLFQNDIQISISRQNKVEPCTFSCGGRRPRWKRCHTSLADRCWRLPSLELGTVHLAGHAKLDGGGLPLSSQFIIPPTQARSLPSPHVLRVF